MNFLLKIHTLVTVCMGGRQLRGLRGISEVVIDHRLPISTLQPLGQFQSAGFSMPLAQRAFHYIIVVRHDCSSRRTLWSAGRPAERKLNCD